MAHGRSVADHLGADEPQAVEAEFEPAAHPKPKRKSRAPQHRAPLPRLSRSASRVELAAACLISAIAGVGGGIVYNGANSNASTGTLASEIDALRRAGADLDDRATQATAEITALRARMDGQSDRLNRGERGEQALHKEIEALNAQLMTLAGGRGAQPAGTASGATPLGSLLSRLEKVEAKVASDGDKETPRQMQRQVRALTDRMVQLEAANAGLAQALDQRRLALAAVESSVFSITSDLDSLSARVGQNAGGMAGGRPIATAVPASALHEIAVTPAQTAALVAALSAAAEAGKPFDVQLERLAAVLPGDPSLAALAAIASHGAPTLDQLRHSFEAAAADAMQAAEDNADDGWGWLRAATSGYIVQRRPGGVQLAARLTIDARRKLGAGDIRAAIAALDGLSGAPARAMSNWTTTALRRLTLDERLAGLTARLGSKPPAVAGATSG